MSQCAFYLNVYTIKRRTMIICILPKRGVYLCMFILNAGSLHVYSCIVQETAKLNVSCTIEATASTNTLRIDDLSRGILPEEDC